MISYKDDQDEPFSFEVGSQYRALTQFHGITFLENSSEVVIRCNSDADFTRNRLVHLSNSKKVCSANAAIMEASVLPPSLQHWPTITIRDGTISILSELDR